MTVYIISKGLKKRINFNNSKCLNVKTVLRLNSCNFFLKKPSCNFFLKKLSCNFFFKLKCF